MRATLYPGLALALCVTLSACESQTGAPTANKDEITKAVDDDARQLLEDFRSKDANRIAAHYAEDAVFAIANAPAISGKEAIAKGMGELAKDNAFALDIAKQKTEVSASGDIAYSRGTYHVSATDPETKQVETESGTYLLVYKRQTDGSWKIVEDINSPSGPSTPAAATPAA